MNFIFLSPFWFIIKTDSIVFTTIASVLHTIFYVHMFSFVVKFFIVTNKTVVLPALKPKHIFYITTHNLQI
nr:MAG TPA: hypothetical protein [Caudoviricetes sp.]